VTPSYLADGSLPLRDITVVSIEQAVAAPFATRQLADLGARVIKVERPGVGDFARGYDEAVNGLASYFVWLNRSKESLSLDLKHPEAPDVLNALLEGADVFIQNLAPGAAARLGLSAEVLRARKPELIVCDVSGYGAHGPYHEKKAYDLLIQCEAGLVSVTGSPAAPAKVGISVADISAGMYAYSAILSALYRRERTGEGASCEVSLFHSLIEWMSHPLYYETYSGDQLPRTGVSHASIAPYGGFATGDGKAVMFGVQNNREWLVFCESVLGRPELAIDERFTTNARRVTNRHALTELVEDAFSALTVDEVVERLDESGIANGRINEVSDLTTHPQLASDEFWGDVESEVGPIKMLRPPVHISGVEAPFGPIPSVGEHTERILTEFGWSGAEIERLRRDGAV
jgi:itaconate CoA-transferase